MNKRSIILLIFVSLAVLTSCGKDNYPAPAETFRGSFIDKETKQPYQTEIGDGGVRIRMMEYSWSETPQPYDFYAQMDGSFQNTKIFKGQYGVKPEGAFVPLEEEIFDIEGNVEKTYEVEPLLRVEWVGEPVVNSDGTATIQVKITRGTTNPGYQQALAEGWLFVSENTYVGNFCKSPIFSTKLTAANMKLGETITVKTGLPNGVNGTPNAFPSYSRKYFLRFGARTTQSFSGVNRYNYTTVKEITTQAR